MKRIKKQHYVPQFYLKNFGTPLFCFDKIETRDFKTNTTKVAFETDFYGIAVEGDESVEKAMSSMEGKFSHGYNALLTKHSNSLQLEFEEAADFFSFLAVQYLRTKHHREEVVNNAKELFDQLTANLEIDDYEIVITDFGKVGLHLLSLKNWPLYSAIVGEMKLVLLNNKSDTPFWTSDNPIVLNNEFLQPPYGNLGIISRGIELHFPLTPELGTIACDPSLYGDLPTSIDITKENVNYENLLQYNSSTRHIFSNNNDFDFTKQILSKKLNSKNVQRSLPLPTYQRTDTTKADYWPDEALLKQIFQVMNNNELN